MRCSVSEECIHINELSLYIQWLQMCSSLPQLCTYTNMDVYLIKLWVESLFYDRCFVLGLLLNVWLEVPETEECNTIIYESGHYHSQVIIVLLKGLIS